MVNKDEEMLRQLTYDIKLTHNLEEKEELKSKRDELLKKFRLEYV